MTFRPYYFLWATFLFLVEVYIALHIRDDFIRPYVGDVLVIILIYAVVRAFFKAPILAAALGTLAFAFGVEILQYFHIVDRLGLGSSQIARVVIGTTFVWEDFLAYTVGCLITLALEKSLGPYKSEWRWARNR